MPKRFIEPDWRKLRQLSRELRDIWYYIWDKADAAGVYVHDPAYMKLDLNLEREYQVGEFSVLPDVEIFPDGRVFLKDFIRVNYVKLKENYNPHKPAFRAIEQNGLYLNSSLDQACFKLEDKEEDEEEDKTVLPDEKKLLFPAVLKTAKEIEQEKSVMFSLEHCAEIAMNHPAWVKESKATPERLAEFNAYLRGCSEFEKNPKDYKAHYYRWRKIKNAAGPPGKTFEAKEQVGQKIFQNTKSALEQLYGPQQS